MTAVEAPRQRPLAGFPLSWLFFWIVLPNLAVFLLWPVIGIPMQAGLAMSCGLALIFSQMPWVPLRALGVILAFTVVTTLYICHLFAIPPLNFELIFQFLSDVRPFRSPQYTAATVFLGLVLAVAVYFAPRVPRFTQRIHWLYAALAIGLVINLDGALASDARKAGKEIPAAGTEVDSAVLQAGIAPSPDAPRHVLVVLVEALGVPAGAEEKALFEKAWDRPEWRTRYDVEAGENLYFGSTTNGELRELCNAWAHYTDFDFSAPDCLPKRFTEAGYETTAVHSFVGDLFGRTTWYPQIGFDNMAFAKDLYKQGARKCPGVFPGACDADVPAILLDRLATVGKPQFVYWLTLNAHIPVVADKTMGTDNCVAGSPAWREDFPDLCRLFQLHQNVSDSLTEMALSDRIAPTDILIVGDHKPPLFDREADSRFKPGVVPWIYLRAKGESADKAVTLARLP